MSFDNQASGAGTDYRPTSFSNDFRNDPIEEPREDTDSRLDASSSDQSDNQSDSTSSDATPDQNITEAGSAQSHVKNLLGESTVAWGERQDSAYPTELDFSGGMPDDVFNPKFNTLEKKAAAAAEPAADATTGQKPPGDRKATPGSSFADMAKKLVTAIPDAAAAASDTTSDITSAIGGLFGPKVDKEAERITENADAGRKHADAQDAQYVKQWRSAPEAGNLAPPQEGDHPAEYTHKNADGSSYTVTNGRISEFTTAPVGNEKGMTYSDIKYDETGNVQSYITPFGQKHMRTSAPDSNGFANWQSTTLDGKQYSKYGGADSATWKGKPVVNENGFHNLIGNGTYGGFMFSRQMDGSHVMTRPEYSGGKMTGLETTTTLPDKTVVTRGGHFGPNGKLQHDSTVSVKEADGPKVSQVKFDGDKASVVEPPKPHEKSAQGDSMLGFFGKALTPDMVESLDKVEYLGITRTADKSFHVVGDLKNVFMEPPNVTVGGFGPLGRVSATPQGGVVDKFDFKMQMSGDHVNISQVHGVGGRANLTRQGLFGRTKGIGSTATTTIGADWNMRNNTILAHSDRSSTRLNASNFSADSVAGKLLSDEGMEASARQSIEALDKHVKSASLKQTGPGVFEGSLDLKQNRFALDQKLPGVKTNIYTDDKIDFTLSKDGLSFKPGEVQVGIQVGNNLENRMSISKISRATADGGQEVMRINFHDRKAPMDIPIPAAQPGGKGQPAPARVEAAPAGAETAPHHPVARQKPQRQNDDCHRDNDSHRRRLFGRRR